MNGLLLGGLMILASSGSEPMRSEGVSFTVSADRSDYLVDEPILLTVGLKNIGDTPISGVFFLQCDYGINPCYLKLEYRFNHGPFMEFRSDREAPREGSPDFVILSQTYEPGTGPRPKTSRLLFNFKTGGFVTDVPGAYEFRASHTLPTAQFQSNVAAVEVRAAPSAERDALAAFRNEALARLVQRDFYPDAALDLATSFITQFSRSAYAADVRAALREELTHRAATPGRLTQAQLALLDELVSQDAQNRDHDHDHDDHHDRDDAHRGDDHDRR
jgi:hypothetical protein